VIEVASCMREAVIVDACEGWFEPVNVSFFVCELFRVEVVNSP
jgi:hypothetical protein